ncbi:hypothetical protein [Novipirellula maiorica]|nr:hypothetical protein [Rhodopirellula maiorica]
MNDQLALTVGRLRSVCHSSINNTMIWAQVADRAFASSTNKTELLAQGSFTVPSRGGPKQITRSETQIAEILSSTASRDLMTALLVFIVAKGEAFLADILHKILVADPRRLQVRVQGVDHVAKIDVAAIVGANSIDDVVSDIAYKQVVSVFYASPFSQFRYLEKVAGFELDTEFVDRWIELKATRDIIVHNNGTINETYLQKSGSAARGTLGETISVPQEYFHQAAVTVKRVTGRYASQIQSKLREKKPKAT